MQGNYRAAKIRNTTFQRFIEGREMQSENCNCTDAECHYQARQGFFGLS